MSRVTKQMANAYKKVSCSCIGMAGVFATEYGIDLEKAVRLIGREMIRFADELKGEDADGIIEKINGNSNSI